MEKPSVLSIKQKLAKSRRIWNDISNDQFLCVLYKILDVIHTKIYRITPCNKESKVQPDPGLERWWEVCWNQKLYESGIRSPASLWWLPDYAGLLSNGNPWRLLRGRLTCVLVRKLWICASFWLEPQRYDYVWTFRVHSLQKTISR